MSYEKNQRLIKKIEELEQELGELKIELKYPTRNVKKSDRLKIGDKVTILNPGRHQDNKGIIIPPTARQLRPRTEKCHA